MRGTEQKNGREFVLGRPERRVGRPGREMRTCARNSLFLLRPREKGGIYKRGRIIGDSLFLLTRPRAPTIPVNSLDRFTDCVQLIIQSYIPPLFGVHRSFHQLHVLYTLDRSVYQSRTVPVSRFFNSTNDKFFIFSIVFQPFFCRSAN